ncbi:MAG: hypothetical protein WBC13_12670, partial [Dokdonella sp.]
MTSLAVALIEKPQATHLRVEIRHVDFQTVQQSDGTPWPCDRETVQDWRPRHSRLFVPVSDNPRSSA